MTWGYSLSSTLLLLSLPADYREVSRGGAMVAANFASCHGDVTAWAMVKLSHAAPQTSKPDYPKPDFPMSDEQPCCGMESQVLQCPRGANSPPTTCAAVLRTQSLHVPSACRQRQKPTSLTRGSSLFAANCASCHAEAVEPVNGPAAGSLAPTTHQLSPKKPTPELSLGIAGKWPGLPGTGMPPMEKPTQHRSAVTGPWSKFVRSCTAPPAAGEL